ncbi:MAG: hypothetical protein RLZZ599_217 [Bacteroidota bacterium]|jgi:hypothetical protein
MNNIRLIVWFVLALVGQWAFLQGLPMSRFGNPYLYIWFLLWLPYGTSRVTRYTVAFILGTLMDAFEQSGGAHTIASLALAAAQPTVEGALLGFRKSDSNEGMTHVALGPYLSTSAVLVVLHHFILFSMENYGWSNFGLLFLRTLVSSALTLLLLAIVHALFARRYAS